MSVRPDASAPAREVSLPDAVAALCRPRATKILVEERDPTDGHLVLTARTATVRAVLDELVASVASSGQGGGGGRGGGSPLSADALDLLDRIRQTADAAMSVAGLQPRRDPRGCRCGWPVADCLRLHGPLPAAGAPLRCCAECWHPPAAHPVADALARLAVHPWPDPMLPAQLARVLTRLTDHASRFLVGEVDTRYVRDTRCPVCRVWDVREQADAGWQRHPALCVVRRAGRLSGTLCTACGAWWAWADDEAMRRALAADADRQAREGHVRAC